MSAPTGAPAGSSTISSINFTGGFPTSSDLAPSIIFIILYAASLPVIGWRLFSPRHRTVILIRPAVFVVCRLAMLIIRAIMSKSSYGIGLLIAELVLVGVGYLFLLEPLSSLWKRLVDQAEAQHPVWVLQIEKLLRISLLAAIACIAASGGLTSSAFQSQSGLNTVVALRHASYCISLGVVGVNCIALTLSYFAIHLPTRQTLFLIPPHVLLLLVGAYRVAQTFENDPSNGIRSPAAFWCLEILPEFLAYCCYLAISIPEWFPKNVNNMSAMPMTENKPYGQAEQGQAGYGQPPRRRRGLIGMLLH